MSKAQIVDETGCTGIAGRMPNAPKLPVPETYFATLWEGVEAWFIYLSFKAYAKGYGAPERSFADLDIQPMYAGQNQRFLITYEGGKTKTKHAMAISIFKRDEGIKIYEVTAYNS